MVDPHPTPEQTQFPFAYPTPCWRRIAQPNGGLLLVPTRPRQWGTVKEAAEVLGMSPRWVRLEIEAGRIPAARPGKRKFVVDMLAVYERARIANPRDNDPTGLDFVSQ